MHLGRGAGLREGVQLVRRGGAAGCGGDLAWVGGWGPLVGQGLGELTFMLPPDPYVKASLMCEGRRLKKRKTSIKKNTLNPSYNEALVFDIPNESMEHVSLTIAVMDYDWCVGLAWGFTYPSLLPAQPAGPPLALPAWGQNPGILPRGLDSWVPSQL